MVKRMNKNKMKKKKAVRVNIILMMKFKLMVNCRNKYYNRQKNLRH